MDSDEFRLCGKEMIDYVCDYLKNLRERRVISDVEPGYLRELLPAQAPEKSEEWDAIMKDVESKIMPGVTHWQHPHFYAYFPTGNSFPSILGGILSDAIGCIGFSWAASPACTELETIVLDWFGQAMGLPDNFITTKGSKQGGGVIQSSASECILVAMLAARNKAINYLRDNESFDGDVHPSVYLPRLTAYCSTEAHSCVEKAAKILLVQLRILDVDEKCSLRGETLRKAIDEDSAKGLFPFFVSTTLGTTASCAFDNLNEIGEICKKEKSLWLHVDAAYAGNSFICPELRHLSHGLEYADSFNTNTNKWLLVNFDCSCLWVANRLSLTGALVVDPLYLQHANENEVIDYRHWGIPLSRRFRSLKLWFVIRKYGLEGLRTYIRRHITLAKYFETLMRCDKRFEIMNDVKLGLVCFRLKSSDALNRDLLAMINATGKIHMIPAMIKGVYIIRFCIVNEHSCEDDMLFAWNLIHQQVAKLMPREGISRPPLTRQKSRQLSFTRSVSKDLYKRRLSRSSLHDGATPILIPDEIGIVESDDEVFCEELNGLHIK